jgi:hypothetical protein
MLGVNITSYKSGSQIVFHNPGVHPLPPGAGQTIVQVTDASGKVIKTSGQVPGTKSGSFGIFSANEYGVALLQFLPAPCPISPKLYMPSTSGFGFDGASRKNSPIARMYASRLAGSV